MDINLINPELQKADSLGDLAPWEYLAKHQEQESSNLGCH